MVMLLKAFDVLVNIVSRSMFTEMYVDDDVCKYAAGQLEACGAHSK